jgi:hypothetical protein
VSPAVDLERDGAHVCRLAAVNALGKWVQATNFRGHRSCVFGELPALEIRSQSPSRHSVK